MATILSMPKWGLAMKTGLVVEWLKSSGATVEQGEPIVEIESEKATNQVEAPITGTLRAIVVNEGDNAPVSAPLAVLTAPGEELTDEQITALLREDAEIKRQKAEALAKPRTTSPSSTTASAVRRTPAPAAPGGRINASPAARRLAQELGVDLASVVGTGPGGMIGREDVQRATAEAIAPLEEATENEQVVSVGGIAAHCLIAGPVNAPHVVLVHGLGGSLTTWALNMPALAEKFRICALDLVGAGTSDKPATADYSVPALADFLAHFLDALGTEWQQVSLIGHSLGGAIILEFATRYPERVQKFVLVDSAGLGPEIDSTTLNLMRSEPTPEHIRAELLRFFASPAFVQQALIEQLYEQRKQPDTRTALLSTLEAAFGGGSQHTDLRTKLATLPHPVLVIWGETDSVIPVAHAQEIRHARQGQSGVLANCGHCPHIERSDEFNRKVISFLSEE